MSFQDYFRAATGHGQPFDYQRRLAGGDAGCACESKLINIPTGLGKTAAVVLAWVWNRVQVRNPHSAIRTSESFMEMGWDAEREPQRGPSWFARTIALRNRFGPFRLAFLETLLRAADAKASQRESSRPGPAC